MKIIEKRKDGLKKSDVELVLEKSLDFWKEKFREKVSLVDIYSLADQIWAEIQGETNVEKEIREYQITRDELESLEKWGDIAWEEDDGSEVYIELVEDAVQTAMLESGKILIWVDEEEDEE